MSHQSEEQAALEILENSELSFEGQFMWGSNYTLLCDLVYQGENYKAVYKPIRGERPLWDFPNDTLAGREVSAYLVSRAAGWDFVPPTILRQEAPAGPGSLQWFIDHDPDYHYFNFSAEDLARLTSVAVFDAVVNNTDRKGGHLLVDEDDKLWLIDHGVCFHAQPKLRTVIWNFAGQPIPPEELARLQSLQEQVCPGGELHQQLSIYLSSRELQAMLHRIMEMLESGVFPSPSNNRYSYPWPPV